MRIKLVKAYNAMKRKGRRHSDGFLNVCRFWLTGVAFICSNNYRIYFLRFITLTKRGDHVSMRSLTIDFVMHGVGTQILLSVIIVQVVDLMR